MSLKYLWPRSLSHMCWRKLLRRREKIIQLHQWLDFRSCWLFSYGICCLLPFTASSQLQSICVLTGQPIPNRLTFPKFEHVNLVPASCCPPSFFLCWIWQLRLAKFGWPSPKSAASLRLHSFGVQKINFKIWLVSGGGWIYQLFQDLIKPFL